jgi:hypothetical protein
MTTKTRACGMRKKLKAKCMLCEDVVEFGIGGNGWWIHISGATDMSVLLDQKTAEKFLEDCLEKVKQGGVEAK